MSKTELIEVGGAGHHGKSPLSQGVRAGDLLFVSGQIPRDPLTGRLVTGNVEAQARQTLENVLAVVSAAGGTAASICNVTAYLDDPAQFEVFNKVYREYFNNKPLPARTTIVARFVRPGVSVEVDAIAWLPGSE